MYLLYPGLACLQKSEEVTVSRLAQLTELGPMCVCIYIYTACTVYKLIATANRTV